jgi:hypothetical protein
MKFISSNKLLKLALRLDSTNSSIANLLFKIAAPLQFDAEDPSLSLGKPYEIVYRVQNSSGQGFWQNPEAWLNSLDYNKFQALENIKQTMNLQYLVLPDPISDMGFLPQEKQPSFFRGRIFAFETPQRANKFVMPQQWDLLNKNGFHLTPVKAKRIWASGQQVFFEPL